MAPRKRPFTDREPDHPDDVFVARTLEFSEWARQNTQILVVFGIVVVLLVGGALYYATYREDLRQQAAVGLERIHQTLGVGEVEAARAELVTYLDRFGGTSEAGEARLLLGQLYLQSGQAPLAVDVLGPTAENLREPIGVQAAMLLAKAHEELGDPAEAERLYLAVADRAELDFQITAALADAARLRQRDGDRQGAADLYRRILDRLEADAEDRGLYEMRLQEVLTEAAD
ncbi:MAG: tetratricopeptide repeat protein [Gemmatimonadetes bacterium]|nr:tetratricopeptide repeat protein [Gemmatimonadota bacterium]